MATTFTSASLGGTYDDDFDKDKHFHQILFNSGRALQARELTQLQTLIYQEIGRFGRNIFKEGAAVSSGGMSINSSYEYIKIASTNQGGAFADIPVGTVFQDPLTNLEARVLEVQPRNTGGGFTYDTLYVQYINDGNSVITGAPTRFGDKVTLFDISGSGYELVTETPNSTGRATRFDVETGDFFVLGRFVNASKQSIILNNYGQTFTGTVGFKVTQEVISVSDDNSLYDNTGDVVNTAAPGADRYRISLTLVDKADIETSDTFVFLANIENSKIVEEIEESDAYNKINELLAIRTDEESGDYIVNPFNIHFEDAVANDSSLELIVSSGTAYVGGFRVNNPTTTKLQVPRPQQTDNFNNDVVPVEYGNYLIVDSGAGAPNLDLAEVTLSTSRTSYTGADKIGVARIRSVEVATGTAALQGSHKVYLQNVDIDSDKSIEDARFIGTSSTNHFRLVAGATEGLLDSAVRLYDTVNNDLLMPTTRPRVESMSDIVLRVQRYVGSKTISGGSSGTVDISDQLGAGENFVDAANWIVSSANRSFISHTVNASTGVITMSDDDQYFDGEGVEVLYYVQKTAELRTKTLVENITDTLQLQTGFDETNSTAYNYYEFDHYDIYGLDSVKNTDASGIDMLGRFTLDDGQRDASYQRGRLILNRQDSAPAEIYVKYSRLQHGPTGDFFAAGSYNTLGYANIPTHVFENGQEVSLFNYVDFRNADDNGTYVNVMPLPKNGDTITADISYYLPRADKLIMTQEGQVQLLMGQQAANPQFKSTPENAIELYKIRMNPNTLNEYDLAFEQIDHPHYTMKDIAELEAKVDRLREYTTLSIAELRALHTPSLDSAGNERLTVGTVTDDASDQTKADTENEDYAASVDPVGQVIRPLADEHNVNLVMDTSLSQGVVKQGDTVYLNYDSEQWAYQELASTFVKVNPNGNSQQVGTIKLSPSSDEWKDTVSRATRAVQGNNKIDTQQAFLWNSHQWNWTGQGAEQNVNYDGGRDPQNNISWGRSYDDASERYTSSLTSVTAPTGGSKFVTRPLQSETIRRRVGTSYVDLALIPWIRSRKVYFHAKGLKPNTKFTPFFDGVKVNDWVREESSFVQFSDRDEDIQNRYGYADLTAHPDGSTELVSDANGEIIGSFFIPSIRDIVKYNTYRKSSINRGRVLSALRFRAGIREFQLLDIDTPDWGEAGSKAFAYYAAWGFTFGIWNPWRSLRWPDSPHPFSFLNHRAPIFSSKEIKDSLDKIAAGEINLVDPKLAGKYGTNAAALTTADLRNLDNTNTMSGLLSDYIIQNRNREASPEVNPVTPPENPLAQTFYVDNQFGLTLTKVQLYFRSKDTGNLPVSIHIRPVVDGKPSTDVIIPDSHVFKNPGDVDAIGTGPVLATIQGRPTTFEFEEPVHLQPWTKYAIVVTSESTEYELFSAQTQQPVFGSTSRTVTTQPIPGSLFLPQNGTNYVESKDQDLMFRLVRAKFKQGGGSLVMKNAEAGLYELDRNPIHTQNDDTTITVKHKSHGHRVGDVVQIAGAVDTNGIPAAELNGNQTIISASLNAYTFNATSNATETGFGGGTQVRSGANHIFSVASLQLENSVPPSSSIDVSGKFTSGSYISGTNTRFTQDPQYIRITPNINVDFEKPRAAYSTKMETDNLPTGERSIYIKVDYKSGNDYVSPMVDLQRTSLIVAGYAMDNPDTTPDVFEAVSETNPSGGTAGSKHIGTPVSLPEPATGLDARIVCGLPDSSDVLFYYRTADADEDITLQPWRRQEPTREVPRNNGLTTEVVEFLPGGRNGTLKPFYQAQTKLVMVGSVGSPTVEEINLSFLH